MPSEAPKIVIAGGNGFLGTSLADALTYRGYAVTILSRRSAPIEVPWRYCKWDGRTLADWTTELEDTKALINLTGRSVDCIKTPDNVDEILRSRVDSTRVLGQAMHTLKNPPPVWVQMSTAHVYGDSMTVVCSEDDSFGMGMAPIVGKAWEAAFQAGKLPQQRGVIVRTSFVLGKDRGAGGGALVRLKRLARFGLGGRVGSGKQGFSWIHEHDLNELFIRAIEDDRLEGPFIATSPFPVPQVEFMRALRKAIGMPIGLPAAAWMVRLGAKYLLRTDPDLALYGRYVVSKRLEEIDFQFRFPKIDDAFQDLFK